MLIFPTLGLWAQTGNSNFTVTGRVLDEDLNPIIGATIYLESTSKGTITDIDGNFRSWFIRVKRYLLLISDMRSIH